MDPDRKTDVLTLSTVHSAKGLEWPFVYIIWLMEGRFPQARAYANPQAVEEERRLLYVASTRAKERLILCYPGREGAASWGGQAWSSGGVSSFVAGLPREVVRYETETSPSVAFARERPLDRFTHPPCGAQARRSGQPSGLWAGCGFKADRGQQGGGAFQKLRAKTSPFGLYESREGLVA